MAFQDQLTEAGQKIADAAKVKAKEFLEYSKTRTRLHAKLEWRRAQYWAFRKMRDVYEPLPVPSWIEKKVGKARPDEVPKLPFKRDVEPFLVVPLRWTRRSEIEQGTLPGRVNGRTVLFELPQDFKDALLQFHDPISGIELEEHEEAQAMEKLPRPDEDAES